MICAFAGDWDAALGVYDDAVSSEIESDGLASAINRAV